MSSDYRSLPGRPLRLRSREGLTGKDPPPSPNCCQDSYTNGCWLEASLWSLSQEPLHTVAHTATAAFPQRKGSDSRKSPREGEQTERSFCNPILEGHPIMSAILSLLESITGSLPHLRGGNVSRTCPPRLGHHWEPFQRLPTARLCTRQTESTGCDYREKGRKVYFKEVVKAIASLRSEGQAGEPGER